MHVQSMKVKHELLLVDVVKQLHNIQGNNSTNFEKQNEKLETQQTLIKTLFTRLNAVEKKNAEFVDQVKTLNEKLDAVENKNVDLVGQVKTQIAALENQSKKLSLVEKKNAEFVDQVKTLNEKLDAVENKNVDLVGQVKTQIAALENQSKKLSLVEKEAKSVHTIENQLKNHQNTIKALTLFSSDLSRLHLTLGDQYFLRNFQQYFIFHGGEYSDSKLSNYIRDEVKTWDDFTKEITERDQKQFDGCDFLQNIRKAIFKYSTYIYPKEQNRRYRLCESNKLNKFIYNNLKIQCSFNVHYISFKLCNTRIIFNNELQTKKYTERNDHVGSCYDDDDYCLYVALGGPSKIKRVLLIHPEDEKKNMIVPHNGTRIDIKNESYNNSLFYLFYIHR